MTILFGHPTGNPNSHHAALAHFEAGRLEAFCVPWMPSLTTLRMIGHVRPLRAIAQRLARRHFAPLAAAPKIQGRTNELRRLAMRACGFGGERLAYDANDWLMATMAREVRRPRVTAVHAYEDCSVRQFVEAKRAGKACIYDMPIGYYAAWREIAVELARSYGDWLPGRFIAGKGLTRPEQKRQEIQLSDLILVPSLFVRRTLEDAGVRQPVAVAPYGVDTVEWEPSWEESRPNENLVFLFVGQCSLRKGIPLLLQAWGAAGLKQARLVLVGPWQLAENRLRDLPTGVTWHGPVSKEAVREFYQQADVFVFPTFFEGQALVVAEAMSCGLPVLTTPASGAENIIDRSCGVLVPPGDLEALVEMLRWFAGSKEYWPAMSRAARDRAEQLSWARYRGAVSAAVAQFV